MMILSANTLTPVKLRSSTSNLPRLPTRIPLTSFHPLLLSNNPSFRLPSISASAATAPNLHVQEKPPGISLPNWEEFTGRVSGEWDGFGAEFTAGGQPIELPESVVPEAFREWGVQVFDWQTQCPTLAAAGPSLAYKLIKLLPTVGCEADAATQHSVEARTVGGPNSGASVLAYDPSGCYLAAWPVERLGKIAVEVEHCLVDPRDREVRVRVVQIVGVGQSGVRLEGIKVFSEQWYGPFRNGEQLGGCAIRESGFASTAALEKSEVVGEWQGTKVAVASLLSDGLDIFHELMADSPQKCIRDEVGLVPLPKQLWCTLKENVNGETWGEVGWLLNHGSAMTSRCVFDKNGGLKEIAIGQEAAANSY